MAQYGQHDTNAEDAVNIRAGNLIADKDLTVVGDTINVTAGRATHDDYSENLQEEIRFLSSKTSHDITQTIQIPV